MDREVERTELMCATCGQATEQEVTYAGRLMISVRCLTCGTEVHVHRDTLPDDYVADLRQRFASKPRRLAHRIRRHPLHFMVSLPRAVLRQPVKLLVEYRTVQREARRERREGR